MGIGGSQALQKAGKGFRKEVRKSRMVGVQNFFNANNRSGGGCNGSALRSCYQYMNIPPELSGCGDNIQCYRFQSLMVVFSNHKNRHNDIPLNDFGFCFKF
jgi:hypothetical protein